mmetsp:Transcript_128082/g.292704  ORF Transcript_128082/g.292704 Transcript_128082/m.292704 type:complete len:680 (-) Transcript_128082:25-2064(-)
MLVDLRFSEVSGFLGRLENLHSRVECFGALGAERLQLPNKDFLPPAMCPASARLRTIVKALDGFISKQRLMSETELVTTHHCITLVARFMQSYVVEVDRHLSTDPEHYKKLLFHAVEHGLKSYADIFRVVSDRLVTNQDGFHNFSQAIIDIKAAIPDWVTKVGNNPEVLGLVQEAAAMILTVRRISRDVATKVGGTELSPPVKSLWRVVEKIFLAPGQRSSWTGAWSVTRETQPRCGHWPFAARLERSCPLATCGAEERVEDAFARQAVEGLDASRVLDAARAAISCGDAGTETAMRRLCECMLQLHRHPFVIITRIKDRFTCPSEGGWRDALVNILIVPSRTGATRGVMPEIVHPGRYLFALWSTNPDELWCPPSPRVVEKMEPGGVPLVCLARHHITTQDHVADKCSCCGVQLGELAYSCTGSVWQDGSERVFQDSGPEAHEIKHSSRLKVRQRLRTAASKVSTAVKRLRPIAADRAAELTSSLFQLHHSVLVPADDCGACDPDQHWCPQCFRGAQRSLVARVESVSYAGSEQSVRFLFPANHHRDTHHHASHGARRPSSGPEHHLGLVAALAEKVHKAQPEADFLGRAESGSHLDQDGALEDTPQYDAPVVEVTPEQIIGIAHVGEIQLVNGKLFMIRSSEHFKGHDAYASSRAASELIEMFELEKDVSRSRSNTH